VPGRRHPLRRRRRRAAPRRAACGPVRPAPRHRDRQLRRNGRAATRGRPRVLADQASPVRARVVLVRGRPPPPARGPL
ncbi:MAG: hypothetical protein AVDCRST_MAG59-4716, partial [uncultured Thermomicrobiales bacterium]